MRKISVFMKVVQTKKQYRIEYTLRNKVLLTKRYLVFTYSLVSELLIFQSASFIKNIRIDDR